MKINLDRIYKKEAYTIGRLYINNRYFCDTLEDRDRGLTAEMPLEEIKKIKVFGETAIPTGTYTVTVQYWTKHKIFVPALKNVPAFSGILIHSGTTNLDTTGYSLRS